MIMLLKICATIIIVLAILLIVLDWNTQHAADHVLFAEHSAPSTLPNGLYPGSAHFPTGPWKGKIFDAVQMRGMNVVTIRSTERHLFPFQMIVTSSLRNPNETVLRLEYNIPENPWWLRPIADEVVEVAPGKFLGKIYLRLPGGFPLALGYFRQQRPGTSADNEIRYVAIGDSYTIGEGAEPDEAWPTILTNHLRRDGINITLVANPARTGWTTQNAIEQELPIYDASNPTFATLLIGVNDYVQGIDATTFQKRLHMLIDRLLARLASKNHLILITIPDFSVTPTGARYGNGRDSTKGIAAFNAVIATEAQQQGLQLIDIFALSQAMGNDPTLVAADDLHPSAKEYSAWEKIIFPIARDLLQLKTQQ